LHLAVLTMLKAYPGLSGADLARVAVLTPQTVGVIIGNLERDGAIRKEPHPVHGRDADPPGRQIARQMPASHQSPGAAASVRAFRKIAAHGPALAVENCRRPAPR
jgi:hypothetical protein